MNRRRSMLLVAIGLLMALPAATRAASTTVDTAGFKYQPGDTTVTVGGTVTWTNHDTVAHDAVARDLTWRTPKFLPNQTAEVTFDTAGSYAYYCSIHPNMTGTINVVALPATDAIAPLVATDDDRALPIVLLAGLAAFFAAARRFGRGRAPTE